LSLLTAYRIPNAITIIAAIVTAEAIKDLLNAVFGSSPCNPKYSMKGKLLMGHTSIDNLRISHIIKLSLLKFNFLSAPSMFSYIYYIKTCLAAKPGDNNIECIKSILKEEKTI
jgi:hypothetical protein